MAQDSKVVSLHSQGKVDRFSMPNALVLLRDVSGKSLRTVLSDFFDSSDDALFSMAEKAASNQDQTAYFDAMRELRLRRKNMTVSVLQWVSRAFNEIGRFDPMPGMTSLDGIDQNSLSLLDNADLEQKVAIESLINKLRGRYGEAIQSLGVRVAQLVPNVKLHDRQVPLSPEVICTGLSEACGDLEIDIRAKLIVLKLFDQLLISKLEDFYRDANRLLAEQGVMPDLKRTGPDGQPGQAAPSQAYRNPPMQARTQPDPNHGHSGRSDEQFEQAVAGAQNRATFSELSALLHQDGQTNAGVAGVGNAAQLDTHALMGLLGSIQKPSSEWTNSVVVSLSDQLSPVFQPESGPGYSVRQVDRDVISLVSMLFDFILEDRQLPSVMKVLIGRLQIPVLKVALSDQSFFNRGGHPARKLLNELALAGIGWVDKGAGQRDPLKDKIESVVNTLLDDFTDNVDLFSELLADFTRFMDLDQRRRALVEQRLRDAEEGRAIQERAKQAVDELLAESVSGHELAPAVKALLDVPWRKYLQWLVLREGSDSDNWCKAAELTRRLVWSVDPEPIGDGTRNELLRAIPAIVDGLRKGLQTISWDPFATDNAIRDLELVHVDVFQRLVTSQAVSEAPELAEVAEPPEALQPSVEVTVAEPEPEPEPEPAEAEPELSVQEPEAAASVTQAEPDVASVGGDWLAKADALPVGSWVELLANGSKTRCKLAAFIKATGKFIFVNRNGAKVAEFLRDDLARSLAAGEIAMLDDGLIFDRALESIIDNLRSNRRD